LIDSELDEIGLLKLGDVRVSVQGSVFCGFWW